MRTATIIHSLRRSAVVAAVVVAAAATVAPGGLATAADCRALHDSRPKLSVSAEVEFTRLPAVVAVDAPEPT